MELCMQGRKKQEMNTVTAEGNATIKNENEQHKQKNYEANTTKMRKKQGKKVQRMYLGLCAKEIIDHRHSVTLTMNSRRVSACVHLHCRRRQRIGNWMVRDAISICTVGKN